MQVTLEIPDEMALLLGEAGERADRGLLLEAAASLVARGRISSGRAARLLGMNRLDFLDEMTRRKLSVVEEVPVADEEPTRTMADALRGLMECYADTPMDFADACVTRLAELHEGSTVCTTDSDFLVYRRNRMELIPLLAPFSE